MFLTRPIAAVESATPRARIVHLDMRGVAFPFEPGQAIWIGAHGQPQRKPYSIASAPEDLSSEGRLQLLVGVDATGVAGAHLPLEAGVELDIEGPGGGFTFPVNPKERRFLFVAGGTGIAPLRSMLRHALTVPHESIGLMYSARLPEEHAYAAELQAMAGAGSIELRFTATRVTSDDAWTGGRGRMTQQDLAPLVHDPHTLCFVCGPQALVDEVPGMLHALGVLPECVRIEEWA